MPLKFKVGQTVTYTGDRPIGERQSFEVTRLLPFDGDDPRYRIKSAREPYERVAMESQLQGRSSTAGD